MKIIHLYPLLSNDDVLRLYPLFNSGERCDMIDGPCVCGAWHDLQETKFRIEEKYGKIASEKIQYLIEVKKHE